MVPRGRARAATSPLPRLVRLARRAARTSRRDWSSRARRRATGPTTTRPGSTTCTASTASSPTSTPPTPRCATRSHRSSGFWLELGVAGFRLDAVPALLETAGAARAVGRTRSSGCADLRAFASRRRGDAMLLGEVNVGLKELAELLRRARRRAAHAVRVPDQPAPVAGARARGRRAAGDRDPRAAAVPPDNGVGDVPAQPRRADARPAHRRRSATRSSPPSRPTRACGSTATASAAAPRRCSAATADRLRMAWSLMFSLPGSPVLLYGDEIGMGDNLELQGRMAVRVPMQWSDEPNGGFSTAPPERLVRPLADRRVRPGEGQRRRRSGATRESLLNWMERLIRRRARDARDRLGHGDAARDRGARAVRPAQRLGGEHDRHGPQPRRGRGARPRSSSATTSPASTTCSSCASTSCSTGAASGDARALRLPVAARAPRRAAQAELTSAAASLWGRPCALACPTSCSR